MTIGERLFYFAVFPCFSLLTFFMQKALEMMGWNEGSGVGKTNTGVAEPLKVKRLKADAGLGRSDEAFVSDAWIENVTGFSAVLSKLNAQFAVIKKEEEAGNLDAESSESSSSVEKTKDKKKKDKKKDKKKEKKKSKKKDKKKREKREKSSAPVDGGSVVKSVGVISQKRLRAKNMHSFSHEDLQAIMGKAVDEKKEEKPVIVAEEIYSGMFVRATK